MGKKRLINFTDTSSFYYKVSAVLLGCLIIVVLLSLAGGVIKTFIDLQLLLKSSLETALRQTLINVLTMLAVVEVLRTALSYLTEGRVRVTFIIDTVLIVMLNEIISGWFKGEDGSSLMVLIFVILALIVARILTIRYSPDNLE